MTAAGDGGDLSGVAYEVALFYPLKNASDTRNEIKGSEQTFLASPGARAEDDRGQKQGSEIAKFSSS